MPLPPEDLLVSPAWLQDRLDDPRLRVLDCSTWMTPQPVGPSRIASGRPDWARAHIPGAQHVCMVDDLSDPDGAFPYTLPGEAQIGALLGRLGVGPDHHVVLYSQSHPMVATRAWWVLGALGHERVSLLDGGWPRWRAEGRPVVDEAGDARLPRPPATFTPRRRSAWVADAARVAQASVRGDAVLLNALGPEQFAGTGGAHYGRPGRIPGSVSLPARTLVDAETHAWPDRATLAQRLAAAGAAPGGAPVLTYCGGGIAASVPFFALQLLGHADVALYDASLLEWSADPARPMVCDAPTPGPAPA